MHAVIFLIKLYISQYTIKKLLAAYHFIKFALHYAGALLELDRADTRHYGSQYSVSHGQGRIEEANRKHEVPSDNGAMAFVEKHSRVSIIPLYFRYFK